MNEPVSTAYRPPVYPCSEWAMSLQEWVEVLPVEHKARVQLGLLRRQIERLEEEILRLKNER